MAPAAYPRVALRGGFRHREGSALALASSLGEPGRLSPPIWPCTTRGFPCLAHCCASGGLLPHLFTLTFEAALEDVSQVSLFDVTELAPPAVYSLWHFP